MTLSRNISIADQLNTARLAINNTLSSVALLARVSEYGYSAERLAEGQALYASAIAAVNAQTAAAGDLRRAVAQVQVAEQSARAQAGALAQLARAVFPPAAPQRVALGLSGRMPQGTADFLAAAERMFSNALHKPALSADLAEYGYNAARLNDGYASIAALASAVQARVAAAGAAQEATRAQNQALTELAQWVARYLKIARIALSDTPQQLVQLGVNLRSRPRATKRPAAPPASQP